MNAELVLAPTQQLELHPSPLLLGFVELLALPAQELEQRISRELADNPALERTDHRECGACGSERSMCSACGAERSNLPATAHHVSDAAEATLDGLAERTTPTDRLLLDLR